MRPTYRKTTCLLIAAGLLFATAAGAADVQVTADPKANLARYATFAFAEPDAKSKGAIADKAVRDRLRRAAARAVRVD